MSECRLFDLHTCAQASAMRPHTKHQTNKNVTCIIGTEHYPCIQMHGGLDATRAVSNKERQRCEGFRHVNSTEVTVLLQKRKTINREYFGISTGRTLTSNQLSEENSSTVQTISTE